MGWTIQASRRVKYAPDEDVLFWTPSYSGYKEWADEAEKRGLVDSGTLDPVSSDWKVYGAEAIMPVKQVTRAINELAVYSAKIDWDNGHHVIGDPIPGIGLRVRDEFDIRLIKFLELAHKCVDNNAPMLFN